MYRTVKQEVQNHEYTRVILSIEDWKYLFTWAKENMPREEGLPEPHGTWWAVPAPTGVEFYFYREEDAATFLLSAPLNQAATA